MKVKSGDILNAYVKAPVTKKMRNTLGSKSGKDARKTAVIVRALFGLSQLLEATLLSVWNPWGISLVRLTWIYGLTQKSDRRWSTV